MKLKDKVAMVTGGGGGLGREIALAFAREGADLVLVDMNRANAVAVVREARMLGRKAITLRADVSRESQVRRTVNLTLQKFGKIDILVNNAGVGFGSHRGWGAVKDLALKDWQTVMNTNLTGTFLCSKAVLPSMMQARSGQIINISSGMARRGKATFSAYSASKAGIESFTQALSQEAAPFDIRVNALAPGHIMATPPVLANPHTITEFFHHPSVVRAAIVALAADNSKGATGQCLNVVEWNQEHGIDNSQFRIARDIKQ